MSRAEETQKQLIQAAICVVGVLAFGLGHAAAAVHGQASNAAATAAAAPAVPAWVDYCRRHASDCQIDPGQPLSVSFTPQLWNEVASINSRVNHDITPVTDAEHWGVPDHWDLAEDGYGDCEDFQLLKRKLLVAAGVPRRDLLMTVVLDEEGAGHAVLMVRTDRGDFILDNMRDDIRLWDEAGYAYVKRESQYFVGWVKFGGSGAE